jgi:hypothetical protein
MECAKTNIKCILTNTWYTEKNSVYYNSEVFIISIWELLQNVSVHRDHLHVIHISKSAKQKLGFEWFI